MKKIILMICLLLFGSMGFSQDFQCGGKLEDSRDGRLYNTVQIGDQCWMAENLNFGTINVTKHSWGNNDANAVVLGALYPWNWAMDNKTTEKSQGVCPLGWHIPDTSEVVQLFDFLGGQVESQAKMKKVGKWEPSKATCSPPPTNSSGFSAIPSGTRFSTGAYMWGTISALWWTSTKVAVTTTGDEAAYYFGVGYCRVSSLRGQLYRNPAKAQDVSVRCVKD